MQKELATPFDPGRAPLVRAVLMREHHRATLILTAHHSIADDLSLSFAIRDTLLAFWHADGSAPADPPIEYRTNMCWRGDSALHSSYFDSPRCCRLISP
jgi:hypothetical protein